MLELVNIKVWLSTSFRKKIWWLVLDAYESSPICLVYIHLPRNSRNLWHYRKKRLLECELRQLGCVQSDNKIYRLSVFNCSRHTNTYIHIYRHGGHDLVYTTRSLSYHPKKVQQRTWCTAYTPVLGRESVLAVKNLQEFILTPLQHRRTTTSGRFMCKVPRRTKETIKIVRRLIYVSIWS